MVLYYMWEPYHSRWESILTESALSSAIPINNRWLGSILGHENKLCAGSHAGGLVLSHIRMKTVHPYFVAFEAPEMPLSYRPCKPVTYLFINNKRNTMRRLCCTQTKCMFLPGFWEVGIQCGVVTGGRQDKTSGSLVVLLSFMILR